MNGITKQTRRQSYDGIRTRSGERCKLILETLGNRSMTVEEITDELVAAGHLKYYDRNFVAPRLTELKGAGAPAFKLVAADGGLWKSQAVDNVKNYLVKALADVPERERITIIA